MIGQQSQPRQSYKKESPFYYHLSFYMWWTENLYARKETQAFKPKTFEVYHEVVQLVLSFGLNNCLLFVSV